MNWKKQKNLKAQHDILKLILFSNQHIRIQKVLIYIRNYKKIANPDIS